eukprot:CAMPEP_0177238834 /NCGR_PEP_ID=MMETSP0367-20130122/46780_1 /TAXON_ID=447022 ORGANISM="Scrippsiella hangoei-like, Strain SHHI-4" /NCGR_SAMPLE_ID=MMETSP0367 /ASSEMBLY_ACC=CAM_ASM_000362 /LENGTH=48 /DNA_ID= /DNA_START= /DNA_END= /DNA_ORIENTATION=
MPLSTISASSSQVAKGLANLTFMLQMQGQGTACLRFFLLAQARQVANE